MGRSIIQVRDLWYAKWPMQTAPTQVLEAALIVLLPDDCFAHILSYLELLDISLLRLTGNTELWAKVQRLCREIRHEVRKGPWMGFEPSIIFPALKLASNGFSNLETITIQQYRYENSKGPSPLGTLPATLRRFTLELAEHVEDSFFEVDYASIYPKLLTLRVCSFYVPSRTDSENQSSWIYRLPKSLTILGLQNVVNDNVKFAEYLCGIASNEATSLNDVDTTTATTSWPLPNLQYLELGARRNNSTTYPSISKYPPSLKYLRIHSRGHYPLQMHLPLSLESPNPDSMTSPYYMASPASQSASSSNDLESDLELVLQGPCLRYYATDTITPDILPTLHLAVDSLPNLSSLPMSLTSFTGHLQNLDMSNISLLPRRLRHLNFQVWEHPTGQLWPEDLFPNLTCLCVTEFWDTSKQDFAEANVVFPALPKTLRRLEAVSPPIPDADTMAQLPPSLTILNISVDHMDGEMSLAIPRDITHLRMSILDTDTELEETSFSLLPPNLLQLRVESYSEFPALALAHLPRSLRALHLRLIKLPAMPASLSGISGSVSSWVKHAFTGTDPKDGHRTCDWIDHCLTLLPPGCLCTANFCRDGDRSFRTSSASLTHLRISGMKSTAGRPSRRVEEFFP